MFVNELFTYLTCAYVKSSTFFHMKRKILADFQICISVTLKLQAKFGENP